ncbi:glycine zipper domain-containing protein [Paraflavisolibacter sp. H34]|uniref:glycine zipper domain-containing protein n=1 Tax=Huijunlia imazamoxiresistens TaxID=3127457 RepID=UPI0030164F14
MKHILPIAAITALMATACNTTPKTEVPVTKEALVPVADTAGFAQFQEFKKQEELKKAAAAQAAAAPAPAASYAVARSSSGSSRRSYSNYEGGSMNSESGNAAQAPQKRGWSKAAKGAVIGAGTGAVVGAVVNKRNRVVGGVVGGVLGGGVGYGIGRHMDKKDGRY